MTRTEFVRAYAQRSGLSDKWADLGFIEAGGHVRNALPCSCGDELCEKWVMVGQDAIQDYLQLYAPDNLRDAYMDAVKQAEAA